MEIERIFLRCWTGGTQNSRCALCLLNTSGLLTVFKQSRPEKKTLCAQLQMHCSCDAAILEGKMHRKMRWLVLAKFMPVSNQLLVQCSLRAGLHLCIPLHTAPDFASVEIVSCRWPHPQWLRPQLQQTAPRQDKPIPSTSCSCLLCLLLPTSLKKKGWFTN